MTVCGPDRVSYTESQILGRNQRKHGGNTVFCAARCVALDAVCCACHSALYINMVLCCVPRDTAISGGICRLVVVADCKLQAICMPVEVAVLQTPS